MRSETEKQNLDYKSIESDNFDTGHLIKNLKEVKRKSNDFFEVFLINFEDLLCYVEQLEKQVKELNLRLATNTPKDVQLLLDAFNEKLIEEKSSYVSIISNLVHEIEKVVRDLKTMQCTLDSNKEAQTAYDNGLSQRITQIEEAVFFNSLPIKLIKDESISDKDGLTRTIYKFLNNKEEWHEMSKEKFDLILKYYIAKEYTEPFVFSFVKTENTNALLFDNF